MILAGDIGGTNTRFGCLTPRAQGGWAVSNYTKVKVVDFPTFDDALGAYLSKLDVKPKRAAFAAAGPVEKGYVTLTNADWRISAQRVKDMHGMDVCALFNDFEGMARSINELSEGDFKVVRDGQAQKGEPVLVAGPGTGFGVGYLVTMPSGLKVLSSEGGHMSYSPQTPLEYELFQVLRKDRDFVSLELVSSGTGLSILHKAVSEIHGTPYTHLTPSEIRKRAEMDDPICRDICEIRAAATMGAIGDLALAGGARGGIVLAGGVSERMIDFYMEPAAMDRFLNRGPRSNYVKDIPIRLVKSPMAPLIGSAALLQDRTT